MTEKTKVQRFADLPKRIWTAASADVEDVLGHVGGYLRKAVCWNWTGYRMRIGYGQLGRNTRAHCAAKELATGESIPAGMEIDHLCRNRACVRPDHLEIVTHAENVRRSDAGQWARAKTHCPRGHAYEGDNVRLDSAGRRRCVMCRRENGRLYKERRSDRLNPDRQRRPRPAPAIALLALALGIGAMQSCATTQPAVTKISGVVDCTTAEVQAQLPAVFTDVQTALVSKDYLGGLGKIGERVADDVIICAVRESAAKAASRASATPGAESPNADAIQAHAAEYLRVRDARFSQ